MESKCQCFEANAQSPKDHISVCICTYKRPGMLKRALEGVLAQEGVHPAFCLEIVVVDNDSRESAREIIKEITSITPVRIIYDCEPEKNIALARNRALQNAMGNLIAFLDDDEIPTKKWLFHLYNTLYEYGADGVLGPVIPYYPPEAPGWLQKSDMFERRRFPTGTKLRPRDTRTGNVLAKSEIFRAVDFDPRFGLTGGEDVDFFEKQIQLGRRFVWCDEAKVFEIQPRERWSKKYFIRRAIRTGVTSGRRAAETGGSGRTFLARAVCLAPVFSAGAGFSLLFGPQIYMKCLVKAVYYVGWILGFLRITQPKFHPG